MKYLQLEYIPHRKYKTTPRFYVILTLLIIVVSILVVKYTPILDKLSERVDAACVEYSRIASGWNRTQEWLYR